MAAHENIHPLQFKLFMGAQEWQESVTDSVDRPFTKDKTMKSVWASKLKEAKASKPSIEHGAGIHQSMTERGYQHNENDPPTIQVSRSNEQVQEEGHHRIVAGADIERTTGKHIWIPTRYTERGFF